MVTLHEYEEASYDHMKNQSHQVCIDEELSHVPVLEKDPPQDSIEEKEKEGEIDEESHQVHE